MLAEIKLCKRYIGVKFGYGEPIPAGTYAVPAITSHGQPCFMKLLIDESKNMSGMDLFWNEALTIPYDGKTKPEGITESSFSSTFRYLMNFI